VMPTSTTSLGRRLAVAAVAEYVWLSMRDGRHLASTPDIAQMGVDGRLLT
jgi:hypothetical protein